jgi:hypothetical protein
MTADNRGVPRSSRVDGPRNGLINERIGGNFSASPIAGVNRVDGRRNGLIHGPLGGNGFRSVYGVPLSLPAAAQYSGDGITKKLNRRERRITAKFGGEFYERRLCG